MKKLLIFLCMIILAIVLIIVISGIFTHFPRNRLEKILIDERPANDREFRAVQIIREGQILNTRLDMELKEGDKVNTGGRVTVVIVLEGAEVILGPNSHIQIKKSSHCIFNRGGKVFIKGSWSVETEYLIAGVEGTKYIVTVKPDDIVELLVLEGVVTLKTYWGVTRIEKSQQVIVEGHGIPSKIDVKRNVIDNMKQWINNIKQTWRSKIFFFYWFYGITMKRDFNKIIREQTYYLIDHDRYADDLSKLSIALSPGVDMEIVSANDKRFEVKATYDKLPGYLWTMTHYRHE